MKAVRLHEYDKRPVVEDVPEPEVSGPFDVHRTGSRFPGIDSDGGMAELLLTTARSVLRLDPSLQPADVAALADAGLTAGPRSPRAGREPGMYEKDGQRHFVVDGHVHKGPRATR